MIQEGLRVMLYGMIGIFTVIGVIIFSVGILHRFSGTDAQE